MNLRKLKKFFGFGPQVDFVQLIKRGAIILDVRSKSEYSTGHIKGSVNISVNTLSDHLGMLKDKSKPIITCCASGMRSASAKNLLKSYGFKEVHNAGSWYSLQNKIR
jgi:phage shock protein E